MRYGIGGARQNLPACSADAQLDLPARRAVAETAIQQIADVGRDPLRIASLPVFIPILYQLVLRRNRPLGHNLGISREVARFAAVRLTRLLQIRLFQLRLLRQLLRLLPRL